MQVDELETRMSKQEESGEGVENKRKIESGEERDDNVIMQVDELETRMSKQEESGEGVENKRKIESDEERDDNVIMQVDELETRMSKLEESGEGVENKRKIESDEERDDNENMSDSPCPSLLSGNETPSKSTQLVNGSDSLSVTKKAVVVLTRLPEYKISALRPPTPQQFYSEDESLSSSDSDMLYEPEGDSSDSDFSLSNKKHKTGKPTRSDTTRAPAPQASRNNNNVSESAPVIISTVFAHCSSEITKVRPDLPEEEVKVDMVVLARKRSMRWHQGKIVDMVTKEDGRLKYKVGFEDKGKSLVSGHHIAFSTTPKLEQLYVGARVVISCEDNNFEFQPGILAELPSRKNRLRFLVFLDEHIPVYVGLPSLHLVCRPLENVLDDLPDGPHRSFMNKYLRDWPYPHLTQYSVGQSLNVDLNGALQRCEVHLLDSSLIQVIFQDNQHMEWIHRGSIRLEHMARFLRLRELQNDTDDSD